MKKASVMLAFFIPSPLTGFVRPHVGANPRVRPLQPTCLPFACLPFIIARLSVFTALPFCLVGGHFFVVSGHFFVAGGHMGPPLRKPTKKATLKK